MMWILAKVWRYSSRIPLLLIAKFIILFAIFHYIMQQNCPKTLSIGSSPSGQELHVKAIPPSISTPEQKQHTTKSSDRDTGINTTYPLTLYAPYHMENPTLCSSVQHLKVIIIVHSAPDHFHQRHSIRRTWTNATYLKEFDGEIRTLFLLGRVVDSKLQAKLEDEFNENGDTLQGEFIDSYHNLTLKGVMGYKWLTERCRNAQFVLKVDDDVVVNTYTLFNEFLSRFENKTKQIVCNYIPPDSMAIERNKKSKWYVEDKYFKGKKCYPQYCSGFMVLFTNDAIPELYKSASMTPFFWVDDVYLYGLVPSRVPGIQYNSIYKSFGFVIYKTALNCYKNATETCNDLVINYVAMPNEVNEIWSFMVKRSSNK